MNTKWTKTKDLSVGMKIAAADLDHRGMFWDEIVSIQPVGRQQVWDIEVQGTHNFVGNQLIAHNTYINASNATGNSLDLDANSLTTGTGFDVSSTANGFTTGKMANVDLTQSAATGTSVSGNIGTINFAPTYSTAITTPAISGNVLNVARTATTNSLFASTLTVSGALASFSDSATQTTGTLTSTADVVRIAQNFTSNSGAALNVTSAGTGLALRVNDDGTFTDTTAFVIDSSGQVGIGTTAPSTLLHGDYSVDGSGVSNVFSLERTDPNTPLNNFGVGLSFLLDRDDISVAATESARIETIMTDIPTAATAMTFLTKASSGSLTERMRIDASGNVGIGTTGPGSKLHSLSTTEQLRLGYDASNYTSFTVNSDGELTLAVTANRMRLPGAVDFYPGPASISTGAPYIYSPNVSSLIFGGKTDSGNTDFTFRNSVSTDLVTIKGASGNVGIGEVAPGSKLSVSGGATIGASYDTTAAPSNGLIIEGNVGIGTTSPVGKLEVSGAVTGKALGIFNETGDQNILVASASGTTVFSLGRTGNATWTNSGSSNITLNLSSTGDFDIQDNGTSAFYVNDSGKIGIGTTSPLATLHVSDSQTATASAFLTNTNTAAGIVGLGIKLSSTTLDTTSRFINFLDKDGIIIGKINAASTTTVAYSANGTDMAEYFVKDSSLFTPGDIVSQASAGATLTAHAYDSRMLGIVSSAPSFVGGTEGPNKILVAIVGQVPVKIATSSAAIAKGDFVTSSIIAGRATKAVKPGFVIGKALEDWQPGGADQILVYINNVWADPNNSLAFDSAGNLLYTTPLPSPPAEPPVTDETPSLPAVDDQTLLNNLKVNQSAEVGLDLRVLGQLQVQGALTVTGEVNFLGQVFFNTDTAGFAAIPLGARYVTVNYDREYLSPPIVTASPVWDTDANVLSTAIDQPVSLLPQQDYIIAASSPSGFTILLEQPAVIDLKFSWTAIAVKHPRTITALAPSPTPAPTAVPTPEPTLTPTPTP